MAYAVKIAQAMSLYHITGIIIWIYGSWLANIETGFSSLTIRAINGIAKYTNTIKPYQQVQVGLQVYIADASIQISNTISVYTKVNCLSLEEALVKGSVRIQNSSFIMCKGLKEKVINLLQVIVIVRVYESEHPP